MKPPNLHNFQQHFCTKTNIRSSKYRINSFELTFDETVSNGNNLQPLATDDLSKSYNKTSFSSFKSFKKQRTNFIVS
jgi:hypothetical protein